MTQESKPRRYSEAFKRQVVQEHEAGISINQLRRKHRIGGSMTIQKWIRQYGHPRPGDELGARPAQEEIARLREEVERLKQKNALLEKAVTHLTLENVILHSTLEVYQEQFGPELSKKNGRSSSAGLMPWGRGS